MDDHLTDRAESPTIWHHGLIARWWANFNLDGPEIAFFREYVSAGQPALDIGCGSGRLLVPWLAEGFDVDGVDASADMIEACRIAAQSGGRDPNLYVQPIHRLDLPRRYRTIVACGVFGLGVTRADDLEGLRRLHSHLLPGGTLLLDFEVGEFDEARWNSWQPGPVDESPPRDHERRIGPDGFRYALRHRVTDVDPAERSLTRELQAWQWKGDELIGYEAHSLISNLYSSTEIADLIGSFGFTDVQILGGYHGGPPTDLDRFHVFVAT